MTRNENKKTAAIIGMAGNMSRHCLIPMLQRHDYKVSGYDTDTDAAKSVQNELDVSFEEDIEKLVRQSNLTIISTSISSTPDVIRQIGPYVAPGNCIFDITSVKSIPNKINRTKVETTTLELLMKNTARDACVLSMHPMHGPTVMPKGQKYIFMQGRNNNDGYKTINRMLKKEGAKVIESNPTEHDKAMAIVQVLTHTLRMLSAEAIVELSRTLDIDIKRLYDFSSPVYETEFNLTARVLSGNPDVYFRIQTNNPYTFQVLDVLDKARKKHGHLVAFQKITEFVNNWKVSANILVPASESLDSVVGQPDDVQLIAYVKHSDLIKKILPYAPQTPYKKELIQLRVNPGSLSRIYGAAEEISVISATFWKPKREKYDGQYVFLMKPNKRARHALELGDEIDEVLFSPWNPEMAKSLPNRYRIQLDNQFSDYYLNLFDTLHTTRKKPTLAEKIGPVIVIGNPYLDGTKAQR